MIVFLVYNYAGLKEHGLGYVKHFLGPVRRLLRSFSALSWSATGRGLCPWA